MSNTNKTTSSILKEIYKERNKFVHKGQFGKLVVIAGNYRYTGSPIFVGLAAYKAGCDLVYLTGPKRAMDVAASYSPILITEPLNGSFLSLAHVKKILNFIKEVRATAVVIGNGLGRKLETKKSIIKLISEISLPIVIDADAIRAVKLKKEILYLKNAVLTPHDNEFLELTNRKISRENLEERIQIAREEACKLNCVNGKKECPINPPITLLLKGPTDIITNGKNIILNETGNPKMTVGGMGDTLAGICGALLARKVDNFLAACASAYINGKAGELAINKFGESTTTLDLIEEIHNAIRNKS